ncbi:MAG TPA: serine hydrolase domain-containing protein [Jiangellales bacterium]|nr:serine hydrolase domain-containing protein [Jiangellales bacterium]
MDEGRLALDVDINTYLDGFSVVDTYPDEPITLRHLLTHTAGFAEKVVGILPAHATDVGPLGEFLAEHQPARVRPPGRLAAYSNYGLALAGLIVEQRSGVPFETYVSDQVLRPLRMHSTTFTQPLPSHLLDRSTTLYESRDGTPIPVTRAGDHLYPAGGAWATVADMGRFMMAHLGSGHVGDARILSADAARQMHTRQFEHDPRLPGLALAFHEWYHGSLRMLGHGGDGPGSHSAMALLPDDGEGIFVVFNGDGIDGGAALAARRVVERFVDYTHPRAGLPDGPAGATASGTAPAAVAGTYRTTRMNHSDYTRLFLALATDVTVTAHPDGSITTTGLSLDPAVVEQHWLPVGDGLFREADGARLIAFDHRDGRVALLDGSSAFQRLAWYEHPSLHLAIAGAGLVLLLSSAAWPVMALVRRRGRRAPTVRPRTARGAYAVAGATALLVVGFIVALLALLADPSSFMIAVLQGSPLVSVVFVPLGLAALGGLAIVVYAALAWRNRSWNQWARVHYTAVATGGVLLFGIAHAYHLTTAPLALLG